MRKFKHIPTGYLYEYREGNLYAYSSIDSNGKGSIPYHIISSGKDWEEIKEEKKPEWTVLSFKNLNSDITPDKRFRRKKDGMFVWDDSNITVSEHDLLSSMSNVIYSVRRESDGEVFTIGDKIYMKDMPSHSTIIEKFVILKSDNSMWFEGEKQDYLLTDQVSKVQPKQWKITAYETSNGIVWMKDLHDPEYWSKVYYDGKKYPIYSVKRLSDGVEFKIGDTVYTTTFKDREKISQFQIEGTIIVAYTSNWGAHIKNLNKAEKLFTSEDGVDIYEGDRWYSVWIKESAKKLHKPFEISFSDSSDGATHNPDAPVLRFSTKEAAEEYILMNKPCLSIMDLISLNKHITYSARLLDAAKELVKSKLK